MQIEIRKPLYETKDGVVVGIREKTIFEAERNRELLKIRCGDYEGIFHPSQIKNNPLLEKKFKYATPMRLRKVFLPKKPNQDEEMRRFSEIYL